MKRLIKKADKADRSKKYDIIIKSLMENDHNATWDEIYEDCSRDLDDAIKMLHESLDETISQLTSENYDDNKDEIAFYQNQLKLATVIYDDVKADSVNDIDRSKKYDVIIKNLMEDDHDASWDDIYENCNRDLDDAIKMLHVGLDEAVSQLTSEDDDDAKEEIEFYQSQLNLTIEIDV